MKRFIVLSFIGMSLFSCTKSPEDKAKENIEKFITSQMDAPRSYEPVSFGKLEEGKSIYQDEKKYKKLLLEYNEMSKRTDDAYNLAMSMTHENTIKSATKSYNSLSAMRSSVLNQIDKYIKTYKQIDIYKIKHSFRGKNKIGTLVLDSCTVILDKNLNVKFIK